MNTLCADKMLEDMRGIPPLMPSSSGKGNRDEMAELQKDSGYGKSEAFHRVCAGYLRNLAQRE
jgi:hypothetical protein